jgi:hypothetical protein
MRILDAEVARWSELSVEQLLDELQQEKAYQVESGTKKLQVEVQLVEDTADYIHVVVSVDDGTPPHSLRPATQGFIKKKNEAA